MGYCVSPLPASKEGPFWGVEGGVCALWLAVAGGRQELQQGLPLEIQPWNR